MNISETDPIFSIKNISEADKTGLFLMEYMHSIPGSILSILLILIHLNFVAVLGLGIDTLST